MHRHLDDADSSLSCPRCGVAHGYANWIYRDHSRDGGRHRGFEGIGTASLRELDIRHTNVDDAAYPDPLLAPTGEASLCYQCRASQLIRQLESAVFCCDHAGIARMRQGDEFVNLLSCYRISDVAAVKQRAEAHAVKLVTLTKTVTPSRDPTSGVMAFNTFSPQTAHRRHVRSKPDVGTHMGA
jgi:hypothetical protein